jgi:hypothetical protein
MTHPSTASVCLRSGLCSLCLVALLAATPSVRAAPIYLRNAPFTTVNGGQQHTIAQYGNNLFQFNQTLTVNGTTIGTISFDYNTYVGTFAGNTGGGAALSGAFFAAPNIQPMANSVWTWEQVITTPYNYPSFNIFQTTGGTYPDTNNPNDPAYPSLTIMNPNYNGPKPTVAFQDVPFQYATSASVTSDQLELALACENTKTHVASIVGTFTWGFIDQAVAPANFTIANVLPITPYSSNESSPNSPMTGPSPGFLSTERAYYNGTTTATLPSAWAKPGSPGYQQVTTTAWTFNTNPCFAIVPEPSSLILAISALVSGTTVLGARWVSGRRRATGVSSFFRSRPK